MRSPKTLTAEQVAAFRRDGYLVVEDALTPDQLAELRADLAGWVEESRAHTKPFGPETIDGRARFDMGAEHTAERPALRRVNNPSDISVSYFQVMSDARTVDMVADLVGPNVKFHHCKINVKLPGAKTEVAYHQDFAFTPHTNDDVVTALLMLDEVTEENGCLMVVPGSHTGPMYSLFQDGTFTGRVDDATETAMQARQVPAIGTAGSVCLMHTRLAHGSAPNASDRPRGLYICVYSAADAVPIARNPMPSPNEGRILRGHASPTARMIPLEVELPKQPKTASFFTVQGQESARGTEAAE
ncbi:MAG: phytanoyl-CoA dioxygenase family protein [Alphaproteobacteria bacterium]|nr:phytanoyl-CoA dioxygenase family protein [Alphaproteobacteria bacterium]